VNNVLWYEFPVSSSKTCNLKGCPDLLFELSLSFFKTKDPVLTGGVVYGRGSSI